MKKALAFILILGVFLAACSPSSSTSGGEGTLTVGDDSNQKSYTVEDLKALSPVEAEFNEVSYLGVPISVLLQDAGIDPNSLKAVKAVASDGYSMNYEPALFLREDVLVAYAQVDGPMSEDDGTFRMVLPGEEGKMNIRFLVEIKAVP
jgi:DMSO/TMAO reductase YedYZ molybdopterin-dependent catalytic subunit